MDHLIDDDAMPRERELTLSSGAILGIFFGLVILCGGFFGFGYNMGRKSVPTPLAINDVPENATSRPAVSQPDPETAVAAPAPTPVPRPARRTPPPQPSADTTAEAAPERPKPATHTETAPAPIVRPPATTTTAQVVPIAPGGTFMVQVAAVSHPEDAQLLVGALRGRGYAVAARNSAADSFIHVQIGPFATKKDAEAMRQRLIGDGYNAIVK